MTPHGARAVEPLVPSSISTTTATLTGSAVADSRLGRLGSDQFGSDFSITGEELDERRRARMLDESLEILMAACSGEPVRHRGEHYTVEGMRFLPRLLRHRSPREPSFTPRQAGSRRTARTLAPSP